ALLASPCASLGCRGASPPARSRSFGGSLVILLAGAACLTTTWWVIDEPAATVRAVPAAVRPAEVGVPSTRSADDELPKRAPPIPDAMLFRDDDERDFVSVK